MRAQRLQLVQLRPPEAASIRRKAPNLVLNGGFGVFVVAGFVLAPIRNFYLGAVDLSIAEGVRSLAEQPTS